MRIGIDLDNTIVNYSSSFLERAKNQKYIPTNWEGDKEKLKKYIYSKDNGFKNWKKLQGQVYGPFMSRAKVYKCFKSFVERSLNRNDKIYIISHKTIFGHYDETQTLLRVVAKNWLKKNKILNFSPKGILQKNLYFYSTRKEKIKKIEDLKLDYFIDDLEDVLNGIKDVRISKILFGNIKKTNKKNLVYLNNWFDISKHIYGDLKNNEIKKIVNVRIKEKVLNIQKINNGINSKTFRIDCEKKSYVCKFYPNNIYDKRNRLKTEIEALKLLDDFDFIPKIITYDEDVNIAIFSWIEGNNFYKILDKYMKYPIKFIKKLKYLNKKKINSFQNASESCLSANDIIEQIDNRLLLVNNKVDERVRMFITYKLLPVYEEAKTWLQQNWPLKDLNEKLERNQQVLSPSDFGFHNSILANNGKVCFVDFEYFGWDDPSKLFIDFIWHPGMSLSEKQKQEWSNGLMSIFSSDVTFKSRIIATWPLYGVRWSLIILKNFLSKNDCQIKNDLTHKKMVEKMLQTKLNEVSKITETIITNKFLCPYV